MLAGRGSGCGGWNRVSVVMWIENVMEWRARDGAAKKTSYGTAIIADNS